MIVEDAAGDDIASADQNSSHTAAVPRLELRHELAHAVAVVTDGDTTSQHLVVDLKCRGRFPALAKHVDADAGGRCVVVGAVGDERW